MADTGQLVSAISVFKVSIAEGMLEKIWED
jgi:hypothetical protein